MGKTKIEVKSLYLRNFKGAKDLKINFNPVTQIFGDNATGKSTIFDSFSWLLFGKNSIGQSDTKFKIKNKEANGREEEFSVEGVLDIDGEITTIKRVLKEKWVKKKGNTERVYEGNSTEYYWNEVPKTQREFSQKIADILSEEVFKMITDPLAFNSLHWEKQRQALINIVGEDNDADMAKGNNSFESLLNKLTNKSLSEFKKELAAKRTRLKKDIQDIPARINEVAIGKPEPKDYDAAFAKEKELKKELKEVELLIEDRNQAVAKLNQKRDETSKRIFDLRSANENIIFSIKSAIREEESNRKDPVAESLKIVNHIKENIQRDTRILEAHKSELQARKTTLNTTTQNLKKAGERWDAENAKEFQFDKDAVACPTCRRQLDAENVEEQRIKMLNDFKKDKKLSLAAINREGKSLKNQKEQLDKFVSILGAKVKEYESKVSELETDLEIHTDKYNANVEKSTNTNIESAESKLNNHLVNNTSYQDNLKTITELESSLQKVQEVDVAEFVEQKRNLTDAITEQLVIIADQKLIENADKRINELKSSESTIAQEIADIENQQFTIEEFETKKIKALEFKVNRLFKFVQFKMFNQLVDGTQTPHCEATYKGVPFNDVNSAGRIKVGLDIINALCNHYQVTAPIFIDNSESITDIPETESQQIRLIVSKKDKTLRVE